MAQYLNAFSGRQFIDANGNPYVGAKLFTYVAGSSTKVTTTKDSAGVSSHTNPIILNARGEPADGAGASQAIWQAGGSLTKLVLAPANDSDPPLSAISTWDNLSGINDTTTTIDQWITGPTPTFVSATQFTLVGDQTTIFHVGRRIKATVTAGTFYGAITVSAYTSLTTITVLLDSGALDSGLSTVAYGVLTAVNPSVPGVRIAGADWTHAGIVTMSGKSLWAAEGASVASVADCNIWTTDGNTVRVTGAVTISDWGTAPQAGARKHVIFDGAPQLTYNATTNDMNTAGVNHTVSAGDEVEVYARSASSYKVTILKYNGSPLTPPTAAQGASLVYLTTVTVSGVSSADITTGISSTYDEYQLHLVGVKHAIDGGFLFIRVSTDGGSTFKIGAADYRWVMQARSDSGVSGNSVGAGVSEISLSSSVAGFGLDNATDRGMYGVVTFFSPSSTTLNKHFIYHLTYRNNESASSPLTIVDGAGVYDSAANAINAIQVVSPSGNIANGTFHLYGVKKS